MDERLDSEANITISNGGDEYHHYGWSRSTESVPERCAIWRGSLMSDSITSSSNAELHHVFHRDCTGRLKAVARSLPQRQTPEAHCAQAFTRQTHHQPSHAGVPKVTRFATPLADDLSSGILTFELEV
jgi:hypothetical protein